MDLEPDGGNMYRPHAFQVNSGQFWRCAHGTTGFGRNMEWEGCDECAKVDPAAFAAWNNDAARGAALPAQPGQHTHADPRLERAQRSIDTQFRSAVAGVPGTLNEQPKGGV